MTLLKQHIFFLIFSSVLFSGCKSSKEQENNPTIESNCSKNVSIQYRKASEEAKKQDMVADKSKNNVVVFFEAYFDGIVKGYVNDELIFKENIVTDESLGTTEKYFTYDYSKDDVLPKLKVQTNNGCVEFDIKKDYKLIYLSFYEEKWDIIYSNVYPTYE